MIKNAEAGADLRVIELPEDRLPEARASVFPHVQRACLRDAPDVGHVYAASRGDELVGVAAWLPPGGVPLYKGAT